jgi:site-specific DNA-methyltransferase (cytosine-N4-specific)
MKKSEYQDYHNYLAKNVVAPFYERRLKKLRDLTLNEILLKRNPYLLKAKNLEVASDLVKSILDAFLYSQEETMFGNLLEGFAIYVSNKLHGGFKSKLKSIDLEFERDDVYYIVGIKSGTNWGNSDQQNKLRDNFKLARKTLRENGVTKEIVAINGCMYGKDNKPFKENPDADKQFYRYAGQVFWKFLTGDDNLYREIISPIDKEARQKDEAFKKIYEEKLNEMTQDFLGNFMSDNRIDWLKLIDFVSKKDEPKSKSSKRSKGE